MGSKCCLDMSESGMFWSSTMRKQSIKDLLGVKTHDSDLCLVKRLPYLEKSWSYLVIHPTGVPWTLAMYIVNSRHRSENKVIFAHGFTLQALGSQQKSQTVWHIRKIRSQGSRGQGTSQVSTKALEFERGAGDLRLEFSGSFCSGDGFPDSSAGTESAYNAGDPSSILGSGRSAGEGIGYPLRYSWASLVAQLVICLQCARYEFKPWVQKIPLEREKAPHSSILAWRIQWTV